MTRWANSSNATAAAAQSVRMVVMANLDFASGHLYVHDGAGTLTYDGQGYSGVGTYGGVDVVTEDLENVARTVQLTLSGVDPSLINSAMTEHYQGRSVTLYIGLLNPDTQAWVSAVEPLWQGRMDFMTIELAAGSATIKLNCENRLHREPLIARWTDQDQQKAHAGDTFFGLLWQIPLASCSWGSTTVFHPATQPPARQYTYPGAGGHK